MSGYGYQPPHLNLMNEKLTLTPETKAIIATIEAQLAARVWLDELATPDFEPLVPMFVNIGLYPAYLLPPQPPVWPGLAPPLPTVAPLATDPNPGPDKARAGEMKDVLSAFYQLPAVQIGVQKIKDEAFSQLRALKLEFNRAPTSEKVIMITGSIVVAASFIAPILAVKDTRNFAFDKIKDNLLPVPGVPGFKFKLLDHGAGVSVPLGVPGLSVDAESQFLQKGLKPTTVMFSFDLMQFLRSRK